MEDAINRVMGDKKDWMPDFEKSRFASEESFLHRHQQRKGMSFEDFEMGRKADTSTFQVRTVYKIAGYTYKWTDVAIYPFMSCYDLLLCAAQIIVRAQKLETGFTRADLFRQNKFCFVTDLMAINQVVPTRTSNISRD